MGDICFLYDTFFCLGGIFQRKEGNREDPGIVKKIFCPMTTVVDAIGYDQWQDILLACCFGCCYTSCLFNPETRRITRTNFVEIEKIERGNSKV